MNTKKIISIILIIFLMFILSGCGENNTNTNTTNNIDANAKFDMETVENNIKQINEEAIRKNEKNRKYRGL